MKIHIPDEVMAQGMATADGASLAWWYRVPVNHPAKILYLSRATAALAMMDCTMNPPNNLPKQLKGWPFWEAPWYLRSTFFKTEARKQQNGLCYYCGENFPQYRMNADHYIPLAKGGADCWCNIVASCKKCNSEKGCLMPDEFIAIVKARQPGVRLTGLG